MSDRTVPRPPSPAQPSSLLKSLVSVVALSTVCACLPRGGTNAPARELLAAGWIDDEPIGAPADADPARLEILAGAGLEGRVLRLDRLLDLYDGARFAKDQHARESLWASLGGYASVRGIDASREVVLRLLDEAYALEELAAAEPGALSEAEQRFVADAIMLLSTDMFLPDSAESLITATLAYRVLTEAGHPRIADNAHWRLYDHVRGVLEGAIEIGPALRADIVVHALYAEREDISAWLEDLGPHAKPPLPSPEQLWTLLEQHRDAIAELERWRPVVAARATPEAELRDTVLTMLPLPRDPGWSLVELPRGTAGPESFAPVVLLEPGRLALEPSSTHDQWPRELDPRDDSEDTIAAIEGLLVRDGRGILLFASAPDVPAPDYAAALRKLVAARASTLELAVFEPALPQDGAGDDPGGSAPDKVVVALPLYVARAEDPSPGVRALRESRIHVQLDGRGPRVRVDGRWLSATATLPSDLRALVERLHRAFPRQYTVSLALADNVQHQQLVDLLAALSGGRTPAFVAVGWLPEAELVSQPAGEPKADRALEARLGLGPESITLERSAPEGLPELEWARLEAAIDTLLPCAPELEVPLPKQGLKLSLSFDNLELVELEASGRKLGREHLDAFEGCVRDRLAGFRLREHAEPVSTEVGFF